MYQQYKITDKQYIEMWKAQKGKCKICGADIGEGYLDVDHDHKTGKVRGLLCRVCNLLLDHSFCTVERVQKAIQYLEESKNENCNS